MRTVSLLFFEAAALALAAGAYVGTLPELMAMGLALGALAILPFVFPRHSLVHSLLALHAAAAGTLALLHSPQLLCVGAMAASLAGWDAGLIATHVSAASAEDRRRFGLQYALRAGAFASLGVLLVAAARTIRVSLGFGSGLALSLAVLILATLFVRTLQRARIPDGKRRSRVQ